MDVRDGGGLGVQCDVVAHKESGVWRVAIEKSHGRWRFVRSTCEEKLCIPLYDSQAF